ncbi:hypothetical protein AAE478_009250 [Parahypoxylon ruwenzoriense]
MANRFHRISFVGTVDQKQELEPKAFVSSSEVTQDQLTLETNLGVFAIPARAHGRRLSNAFSGVMRLGIQRGLFVTDQQN